MGYKQEKAAVSASPNAGWDRTKGSPNKPRDVLDALSVVARCCLPGYTGESLD